MNFVKIVVPVLFLGLSGVAIAEEGNPEPQQLMHQNREQVRHNIGAMGEGYKQEMMQNKAQMRNRHQYRNRVMDGQGLRMQNRMAHRMGN